MSAQTPYRSKKGWTHSRWGKVLAGLILFVGFPVLGLRLARTANPIRHVAKATAQADLRILVALQDSYRDDHRRYALRLEELDFLSSDGMIVRMIADVDSWSATAGYHHGSRWLPVDVDCWIRVGPVSESWGPIDLTELQDGEIRCSS